MSSKNIDARGRFRTKTIAFRLSPEEAEELDMRYKISGYRIKQDFIRDSLFKQKVVAQGNPQMMVSMRKLLLQIRDQLVELPTDERIDEIKISIYRILEVIEAFSHEKKEG